MFLRTCKAFFDKKQKYVRKLFSLCKNIDKYFLVNDYKVNEMMIVFNLKFFMLFYAHYPRCLIYQKKC